MPLTRSGRYDPTDLSDYSTLGSVNQRLNLRGMLCSVSMSKKSKSEAPNPRGRAGDPISLHPLSFEEAVCGLAQVKMPEREKNKPKAKAKKLQQGTRVSG